MSDCFVSSACVAGQAAFDLKPGSYELVCHIPGHYAAGQHIPGLNVGGWYDAGDFDIQTPEDSDSAEQSLAAGLARRIDELPERYREAVRLTEIEGLTQAEMAGRLKLSLSAAKSRVQRGRQMIKQQLLECCHVEFDRCGRVLSYEERAQCCGGKPKLRLV